MTNLIIFIQHNKYFDRLSSTVLIISYLFQTNDVYSRFSFIASNLVVGQCLHYLSVPESQSRKESILASNRSVESNSIGRPCLYHEEIINALKGQHIRQKRRNLHTHRHFAPRQSDGSGKRCLEAAKPGSGLWLALGVGEQLKVPR